MKDYTLIHNWEEKLSAEEEMQAAAIVARTLNYLIAGLEASGCMPDDDDVGIIRAHTAYLTRLTHGFLPGNFKGTKPAEPPPLPPPTDSGVIDLNARRMRSQEGA